MPKLRLKSTISRLALAPLAAFAVAGATPALAQEAVDADPALWVVEDEDTTIYLFGTFHVMKAGVDWFNDEVRVAYDASDEVVVEAVLPEDPAELQPIIMQYALSKNDTPLTAELSEEGQTKLGEILTSLGAPANALDAFTPAFASTNLLAAFLPAMGFSTELGIDKLIIAEAEQDGKPVSALETPEFQFSMLFAGQSEEEQAKQLDQMLADFGETPEFLNAMLEAWKTGDEVGFKSMLDEMNDESEEAYDIIFTNRNITWADWIEDRLAEPGTVFMAVGTGHLAGDDSVQVQLEEKGIASRRAN
ncbi:TraB/GumN family protein [Sphingomicrobium sediminis]|uniref:TraB/GumN family protein n=1 Tax=Sphingomicrobium sediminis TaxID=2950949 RepID=A0A9X2EKQ0_9SPHN|nr:TraB/GumN family protein [Sphingomicrobium sediminis]MCM8557129.1 TraB/GumN family protein [Sphingomicrobium sediminis]